MFRSVVTIMIALYHWPHQITSFCQALVQGWFISCAHSTKAANVNYAVGTVQFASQILQHCCASDEVIQGKQCYHDIMAYSSSTFNWVLLNFLFQTATFLRVIAVSRHDSLQVVSNVNMCVTTRAHKVRHCLVNLTRQCYQIMSPDNVTKQNHQTCISPFVLSERLRRFSCKQGDVLSL